MKIAGLTLILIVTAFFADAGVVSIVGDYRVRVESIVDKRFDRIYRQQYDFSCGSATLASLLSFHYNDHVDELSVFQDMFEHGDQDKIRQHGFSMLDMKQYLSRRGYQSDGYNIGLEQLAKSKLPAITIINSDGYMHFVIVKAQRNDEVLVGDPAVGLKVVNKDAFEEMWAGRIIFLIQDYREIAALHYDFDRRQQPYARANLAMPVDLHSLDMAVVFAPGNWDF